MRHPRGAAQGVAKAVAGAGLDAGFGSRREPDDRQPCPFHTVQTGLHIVRGIEHFVQGNDKKPCGI